MSAGEAAGPQANWRMVPLSQISTREAQRLRPADPAKVAMIAESMRERGQLHPITVYHAPNEAKGMRPWVLSAGLHRTKSAEQLGWTEIAVLVKSAADARLIEIEENLHRGDLSELDRAIAVNERRRLHEELHGPIARGGNQSAKFALWSDEVAAIADRVGLSQRTIKYADKIGRDLLPELREAVRHTPTANNQAQLLKLAKMEPDQQRHIAHLLEQGNELKAVLPTATKKPDVAPNEQDKLFDRLLTTWGLASAETRARFLHHIQQDVSDAA